MDITTISLMENERTMRRFSLFMIILSVACLFYAFWIVFNNGRTVADILSYIEEYKIYKDKGDGVWPKTTVLAGEQPPTLDQVLGNVLLDAKIITSQYYKVVALFIGASFILIINSTISFVSYWKMSKEPKRENGSDRVL